MHRTLTLLFAAITTPLAAQTPTQPTPDPCAALAHLNLPHVTSITAERIATGDVTPATGKPVPNPPPFCRVTILSSPVPASHIVTELWLPEPSAWNHRLLGTGNGGGAGKISYGSIAAGLRRGFASANTDMGTAPSADLLPGTPDLALDFGSRATHEMTLAAKAVLTAFYAQPAHRAYFYGCSTGGQQAIAEAQRFPADYDGILAGAPANNRTHLHTEFLWNIQAGHTPTDQSWLSPETLKFVTAHAVAACHGKDGGAPTDNFLTDPRLCHFDPETLPRCTAGQATDCITPAQLTTLKAIYAGPTNPTTGEQIYPPIPFGAEADSGGPGSIAQPPGHPISNSYPFLWTLGPNWNPLHFNFDTDETAVDDKLAAALNANNPDLRPFQQRGGKLLLFGGTADPLVPFPDALHYYERVVSFEAAHTPTKDALATTQTFFRYFLVPGMAHCGGGPGLTSASQSISPTDNDMLTALDAWVEHDTAPTTFPATGNGLQRNLCAYPDFPTYTTGDPALASSFTCKPHPRDIAHPPADRYLH